MELELRKWPVGTVAETYVRMLTMRVIEKDFILYGDVSVMGGHRKAYREFEFGMMGSGLDPATQETLDPAGRLITGPTCRRSSRTR